MVTNRHLVQRNVRTIHRSPTPFLAPASDSHSRFQGKKPRLKSGFDDVDLMLTLVQERQPEYVSNAVRGSQKLRDSCST